MDKVKVCFYIDGGMEKTHREYNTAEINAIFLSGMVNVDNKNHKIKFSSFDIDEGELGIDLE